MEKLKELMSLCKISVDVSINSHKEYYESVEDHVGWEDVSDKNVLEEMIKRDTVVCVVAYPNTPVSFYRVYHYDLDAAIDEMIAHLREDAKVQQKQVY